MCEQEQIQDCEPDQEPSVVPCAICGESCWELYADRQLNVCDECAITPKKEHTND